MANVRISDLPPASLPLSGAELTEVSQGGFSRRSTVGDFVSALPALSATFLTLTANPDLANERVLTAGIGIAFVDGGAGGPLTINAVGGGQVNTVVGGTNISVNAGDPVNPIINLDAAITGTSVNGVTLSGVGAATNFLDETGAYSVPVGSGSGFVSLTEDVATLGGDLLTVDVSAGNSPDVVFRINNVLTNDRILDIGGVGSVSTSWSIYRSVDQTGAQFWNHVDDHGFSSPNHRLYWENQSNQRFLEFDNSGEVRIGGTEGSEKLLIDITSNKVAVRNGATFYIEEQAAANADLAGEGQFWVRDDVPNVPMFTDDAGTDFVLNASNGAQISGVPANNQLGVWTNATDIEGESDLVYIDGVLTMTYPLLNTSIELNANNGNAIITLDSEEAGQGRAQLFFTSSDVGNGGVLFDLSANLGLFDLWQTNTSGGVLEDRWLSFQRNGSLTTFFNGVAMTRTALAATGGFEVNNTVTGAGFERVLTLADFADTQTGSFTATLTGYAANPTGTINFSISGNLCTLYSTGIIAATSNAVTMTMTGLPAAAQPANNTTVNCESLRNNGINQNTAAASISGGVVTFLIGDPKSGSGFAAAGSKGITDGWSITYPIA